MPDFEVLDAKIASALNKIIQSTHFKKKVSLEEMNAHKEDRFFRGRQIAYLIYEFFRVIGANDSFDNIEMMIFRNCIQNEMKFFYRWYESHLMTSLKARTN